jgi:hypothetical protein
MNEAPCCYSLRHFDGVLKVFALLRFLSSETEAFFEAYDNQAVDLLKDPFEWRATRVTNPCMMVNYSFAPH